MAAVASSRSDSLTRNSFKPRMMVVPSAKLAATASTRYSSIIEGARSGGTSTPRSFEARTRNCTIGSPVSPRCWLASIDAPISRNVVSSPVRRGLVMTSDSTMSAPSAAAREAPLLPAAPPPAPIYPGRIQPPPHRPAAQRRIAVENSRNRAAGDSPHHQPASGTGIAKIERRLRLREPGYTNAAHRPGEFTGSLYPCAQGPHRLGGIQHVLALEQARNPGFADRQRAQNQGTV